MHGASRTPRLAPFVATDCGPSSGIAVHRAQPASRQLRVVPQNKGRRAISSAAFLFPGTQSSFREMTAPGTSAAPALPPSSAHRAPAMVSPLVDLLLVGGLSLIIF